MKSNVSRLLKWRIYKGFLILVAFFSLNLKVNASSFAYDAFNWDLFYEENKDYWSTYCEDYDDKMTENDCLEVLLSGKKEYYTRLYQLLANYESKGYKLDDNIFLATAFYGLTPDTFSDLPENYQQLYKNGKAYNMDLDKDLKNYDVDTIENINYYQSESDSLLTLAKNMFAYDAQCIGPVGTPQVDEEGNTVCYQGTFNGDTCIGNIKTMHLTFFEFLIEKLNTSINSVVSILGVSFDSEKKEECFSNGGTKLNISDTISISEDSYWEFLEESTYFDNKLHLQYKFKSILKETGHDFMSELSEDEREEYNDEIVAARKSLVKEIKSVLKSYESSKNQKPNSFNNAGCKNESAWWPIGSSETTQLGGVEIASGDPVTVTVKSPFGYRIHPIYGYRKFHSGIDITGNVQAGVTNIIAVKDGTVVLAGNYGGYGQCVIIQHNDGTYSLYGHLYSNSITVNINDSVVQGQVIGKIGSTGVSTGTHLHFEIRQGANSSSNAVDPLNYISAENPRNGGGGICSGSNSEFIKMLHWFEGSCASKTNASNYVIHNDGYGYPTVGYGIALVYNIDRFKNYGYDVTNMKIGQELPIDVVDKVEEEEIKEKRNYVNNYLAKNSLTMTDYQIDALTMIVYQFGNLGNLKSTYPKYGNTESLRQYTHNQSASWYYFKENPSTANGRADANWKLFHEGVYTYGKTCN